MNEQELEGEKQKFLDTLRDEGQFNRTCAAVDLVRLAIATTEERIRLGYLPKLATDELNQVITMEYLYRSTELDNQGYNEPVCCTPFYYKAMKVSDDNTQERHLI